MYDRELSESVATGTCDSVNRENKREMRFFLPLFEKEYLEENIVFTRIYGIININQREKRRVERCVKGARRKGQTNQLP